jgi:threonyl-tRNA synthetase
MLIVGEKEFNTQQVSVRQRGEGDKGSMSIEYFAAVVNNIVEKELVIND